MTVTKADITVLLDAVTLAMLAENVPAETIKRVTNRLVWGNPDGPDVVTRLSVGGVSYCRRCDVFIGFGAAGVVRQPQDCDDDWLRSHCWVCGRPADEIAAASR